MVVKTDSAVTRKSVRPAWGFLLLWMGVYETCIFQADRRVCDRYREVEECRSPPPLISGYVSMSPLTLGPKNSHLSGINQSIIEPILTNLVVEGSGLRGSGETLGFSQYLFWDSRQAPPQADNFGTTTPLLLLLSSREGRSPVQLNGWKASWNPAAFTSYPSAPLMLLKHPRSSSSSTVSLTQNWSASEGHKSHW